MGIRTRATGLRGSGTGSAWSPRGGGCTAGSGVTDLRVGMGFARVSTHLPGMKAHGVMDCKMDMGSKHTGTGVSSAKHHLTYLMFFKVLRVCDDAAAERNQVSVL